MICPNCGKELVDDENAVCPECGKPVATIDDDNALTSVNAQQKQPDLIFAAAILTLISAALIASVGYIGLYQYASLADYFMSTTIPSDFQGFLIFGVVCIVGSMGALAGGMFMLKRNNFKLSMLGIICLIISVIVTYAFTPAFSYSFDVKAILMFTEVTVFVCAIISGLFVSNSYNEFS
ncbi:MAG: zinc ribbon domain-containing protein [Candidatus Bathyarchaeota archaeon]|nr:zinc ribbon domain-containing protein [Candidatus Bathyarchaeum sp.]